MGGPPLWHRLFSTQDRHERDREFLPRLTKRLFSSYGFDGEAGGFDTPTSQPNVAVAKPGPIAKGQKFPGI